MAGAPSEGRISWENLVYISDFLKASGENQIALLGGEPTLHPEIVDFILYLIEKEFSVTVFTNGILSQSRLQDFKTHLANIDHEKLTFCCNLNDPLLTPAPKDEQDKIESFLSFMGPRVVPGFNIYRKDFSLDFLFDDINRFGLQRKLRLGITHPTPGLDSTYIRTAEIEQVCKRLYSFREKFEVFRIKPLLDCGFPVCKFSDEELGWLLRQGIAQLGCGRAPLDIATDLTVIHCFPLSNYRRKSLREFASLNQIHDHFSQMRSQIKSEIAGIYPDCEGCQHQLSGICTGGGLCQVLVRLIQEEPVRIAEINEELAKNRLSA